MKKLLSLFSYPRSHVVLVTYTTAILLHLPLLILATWLSNIASLHLSFYFYSSFLHSLGCVFLLNFHFNMSCGNLYDSPKQQWQWLTPSILDKAFSQTLQTSSFLNPYKNFYTCIPASVRFPICFLTILSASAALSFFYLDTSFALRTLIVFWFAASCRQIQKQTLIDHTLISTYPPSDTIKPKSIAPGIKPLPSTHNPLRASGTRSTLSKNL